MRRVTALMAPIVAQQSGYQASGRHRRLAVGGVGVGRLHLAREYPVVPEHDALEPEFLGEARDVQDLLGLHPGQHLPELHRLASLARFSARTCRG